MNQLNQTGRRGRRHFRLFSLFIISLAALALVLLLPLKQVITVRELRTHHLYQALPVPEDGRFALSWTHSIHRTPVVEFYQITDGELLLTQMSFEDYGIGMESGLAPGEELVQENGHFVLRNMNRIFPALHLFIGQVRANHTLLLQGEEIPLGTLAPPGTAVLIQVERCTIFDQIGG